MIRFTTILLVLTASCSCLGQSYEIVNEDENLTVHRDGKLITQYRTDTQFKPVLYPIVGPHELSMTRRFPMQEKLPEERDDHPHHRSLWFTHGIVNGIDFWLEKEGEGGKIVHKSYDVVTDGDLAQIATSNSWVGPDGKEVCKDQRILEFGVDNGIDYIDFEVTIFADDKPVTFGDTKEGSFGIRVPGTMKVDAKKGGSIQNAHGQKNKDAWGKRSPWVDYYGPVKDKTVGIAILNHPSSYGYPTFWHVRTYGLFAANPFGRHDFEGKQADSGAHTIPAGQTMTLRYRVLLHEGTTDEADIAAAFARYEKIQK